MPLGINPVVGKEVLTLNTYRDKPGGGKPR